MEADAGGRVEVRAQTRRASPLGLARVDPGEELRYFEGAHVRVKIDPKTQRASRERHILIGRRNGNQKEAPRGAAEVSV